MIYENYYDVKNNIYLDSDKYLYVKQINKQMHNMFVLHYLLMSEYSKGERHKNDLSQELINNFYKNNINYKNKLYNGIIKTLKDPKIYNFGNKLFSFIDYIKTKPSMPMLLNGINNINFPSTLQKLNMDYFQFNYYGIEYYQINSNIEEIIGSYHYEKETIIIFNNYEKINALYNRESFKKLFRGTLIINREGYIEGFNIDKLGFSEEEGTYEEKYDFTINLSDLIDKKNSYSEEEILDKLYDTFHNKNIKEKQEQKKLIKKR